VAGAIFSGFAMVITLLVPCRELFGLKNLVTMRHLDNMNKILLATSLMVGYAYGTELFMAWYSGVEYEQFAFLNRAFGPYAWAYWTMVMCNVFVPQVMWFKKCRTNLWLMWVVSILVNVGMWMERFVIITTSLSRDFLPSSWGFFMPTAIDILMLIGSFGMFLMLFLLFLRFLPIVAMAEVKMVLAHEKSRDETHAEQPAKPAVEPASG
jgi:molybdopterin-containing oxidoreductase family membrane subunit